MATIGGHFLLYQSGKAGSDRDFTSVYFYKKKKMGFTLDKAALISLVKTRRCTEIPEIRATTNYSELFSMFFQYSRIFDCDPDYLGQLLDIFDDSVLLANGIYYNKTGTTLNNPRAIAASTYVDVNINAGGDYLPVEIWKNSVITNINLTGNTQLRTLSISGGSTVSGTLTVEPGSCIDSLFIRACQTHNSTLNKIVEGSCVNDFAIDQDAIFNGSVCVDDVAVS